MVLDRTRRWPIGEYCRRSRTTWYSIGNTIDDNWWRWTGTSIRCIATTIIIAAIVHISTIRWWWWWWCQIGWWSILIGSTIRRWSIMKIRCCSSRRGSCCYGRCRLIQMTQMDMMRWWRWILVIITIVVAVVVTISIRSIVWQCSIGQCGSRRWCNWRRVH